MNMMLTLFSSRLHLISIVSPFLLVNLSFPIATHPFPAVPQSGSEQQQDIILDLRCVRPRITRQAPMLYAGPEAPIDEKLTAGFMLESCIYKGQHKKQRRN